MTTISIEEASSKLSRLIQQASKGEEVVITEDSEPVAKIVAIPRTKARPKFGSAKGLIYMSDDFDAPLEDFAEYM